VYADAESPARFSLLSTGGRFSVLNRRTPLLGGDEGKVAFVPFEDIHNRLIEIDSARGQNSYPGTGKRDSSRVALFDPEPDYFYTGRSMSAAGRFIQLQVLQPSERVRLELDYTASLKADGENAIAPAEAIGNDRVAFGAIGRGSARLYSPAVQTQTIGGRNYVAIDMGVDGNLFSERRTGLMRLYGTAIPLDSRKITGFVRDLSAVTEDRYLQLQAPSGVSHFPDDLANKNLEYSGIYEDGWVAEQSFLRLQQPLAQSALSVRLMVPQGHKPGILRILADGLEVAESDLHEGKNELNATVPDRIGPLRIDLRFDRSTPLAAPDRRPASALLQFVGFEEIKKGTSGEIAAPPLVIETIGIRLKNTVEPRFAG